MNFWLSGIFFHCQKHDFLVSLSGCISICGPCLMVMKFSDPQTITVKTTSSALHSTAVHCTAQHCSTLHCTALHSTAVHLHTAVQLCNALHCTSTFCFFPALIHSVKSSCAVQFSALISTALHCSALLCSCPLTKEGSAQPHVALLRMHSVETCVPTKMLAHNLFKTFLLIAF